MERKEESSEKLSKMKKFTVFVNLNKVFTLMKKVMRILKRGLLNISVVVKQKQRNMKNGR